MWLPLLAIVSLTHLASANPSTSTGPTSATEAEILWKDGLSAFEQRNYSDAAIRLQRLVDRYPAHSHFLDSRRMLGISRLKLGDIPAAKSAFGFWAEAVRNPEEALEARLWLGKAEVAGRRFHEGQLLALEVEKKAEKLSDSMKKNSFATKALVLRANALMGLGRDNDASRVLVAANRVLESSVDPSLRGEILLANLGLKTRECAKLPSQGPLSEAQAHDQMERRSNCLLESWVIFGNLLANPEPETSDAATGLMSRAYADYARACSNPPPPPRLTQGKRTEKQLKNYRNELRDKLQQDCRKHKTAVNELVRQWAPPKNLPKGLPQPLQDLLEN